MSKQILITTTNTIEGAKIEQYIQLITSNNVIGTNFFSDLGASFTDFFGGFSGTYQDKLEKLYERGIRELQRKALNVGANAVLGVKIDFDEISGKGKSMFMFSISGTAVKIQHENKGNEHSDFGILETVPSFILEEEVNKKIILKKLEKGRFLNEKDWQIIMENPIREVASFLLNLYLNNVAKRDSVNEHSDVVLLLDNLPRYLSLFHHSEIEDLVYSKIETHFEKVIRLLKIGHLFSAKRVLRLLEIGQLKMAVDCLDIQSKNYNLEDLIVMQQINEFLANVEDKGRIEKVRGLLGKEREMYICPDGHKNDLEIKYCQHNVSGSTCDLNIKGFNKDEMYKIKFFKIKVESLQELLNGSK